MDDPLTDFEQAIVKAVYMDCIQQDIGTASLLQKVYTEHKAMRMSARDVRDILRSLKTRHTKLAEYRGKYRPSAMELPSKRTLYVRAACVMVVFFSLSTQSVTCCALTGAMVAIRAQRPCQSK